MKVVLCGGGNAVHVLTALIGALPDCEVSILSLYDDEANRLNEALVFPTSHDKREGITCTCDQGQKVIGQPVIITHVPSQVIPEADVLILSLPAFCHALYVEACAPYFKDGMMLGALPAEGGFDLCVRDRLGPKRMEQLILFATETLPWACRITTFGQSVEILGTKKTIDLAVSPLSATFKVTSFLTHVLGDAPVLVPCSLLALTLMNINSLWHPTIMYGALRQWDGHTPFDTIPLFYQGADAFTGAMLTAVSNEVLAIKRQLLLTFPTLSLKGVRHVSEWMPRAYGEGIEDTTSLTTMLQTNRGYRGLRHPMTLVQKEDGTKAYLPDFKYRYMTEDIPCGLMVTRGIAELAGVATPQMDAILLWAQNKCGKTYLEDGKVALSHPDLEETRCPQRYGYTSLESFMRDNHYVV